jgi:hypothetical protein
MPTSSKKAMKLGEFSPSNFSKDPVANPNAPSLTNRDKGLSKKPLIFEK